MSQFTVNYRTAVGARRFAFIDAESVTDAQEQIAAAYTGSTLLSVRENNPPLPVIKAVDADRLFCGVFPAGLSWADKGREEHGDYKKIAFMGYRTLVLEICDAKSPLLPLVEEAWEKMKACEGERFQVSTSGQWVILGRCRHLEMVPVFGGGGRRECRNCGVRE